MVVKKETTPPAPLEEKWVLFNGKPCRLLGEFGSTGKDEIQYYQIQVGVEKQIVMPSEVTAYSPNAEDKLAASSLIYINEVDDPAVLIPIETVGKIAAKKLVERRPQVGGYTDLDQVKQLNSDLTYIDWVLFGTRVRFSR